MKVGRLEDLGDRRTLPERVGDALTYLYDTSAMLREKRQIGIADRVEIGTNSLIDSLKQRGLKCSCKLIKDHDLRYTCTCLQTSAKQKGKKQGLELQRQRASFRGFVFDGKRCRDGSGAFVSVSQCKGKVGRGPDGRFISVK